MKYEHQPFSIGDLCLVSALHTTRKRIVLVKTKCNKDQTFGFILLSNEIPMATNYDYVISKSETGTSFDLMIQTDLEGHAFNTQVIEIIGNCIEFFKENKKKTPFGSSCRGQTDPRWKFKEEELKDLQEISLVWFSWYMQD